MGHQVTGQQELTKEVASNFCEKETCSVPEGQEIEANVPSNDMLLYNRLVKHQLPIRSAADTNNRTTVSTCRPVTRSVSF